MPTTQNFALEAAQLAVFMIFITAIIEVIKGISVRGVWGILKELWSTLLHNTLMTEPTMKTLNFVVALAYLRVFNYGVMMRILGIQIDTPLAWWFDYIGTASLVYMGADWVFQQVAKAKDKAKEVTTT